MTEFEKFVKHHLNIKGLKGDHIVAGAEQMLSQQPDGLTPYILEERKLQVTQMDIFSRLMKDRIIWMSNTVTDEVASIVQAQLMFLDNDDSKKDTSIYLNTPGGSVKAGLGIVDVMDHVKHDVGTVNTGMCASMGSVLLGAGTKGKRSSLRFSKVMTHEVSFGASGNVKDNRINTLEAEKYNYVLFQLLARYSGKTFAEVNSDASRDYWMSSEEALEYGLIDNIVKTNTPSYGELMKGFDGYYKKLMNIS